MKNLKKFFTVFLSLVITLTSFTTFVSAADEGNEISFEEYASKISAAYLEEGVEIEPIKPQEEIIITEEMLANDLKNVHDNAEKIKADSTIDDESILATVDWNDNVITHAMYGNATGTATYNGTDISNPVIPRYFTIKVTAKVYGDINNCTILEAYSPSLTLTSATGYADYIKLSSYSTKIDNSSSKIANHNVKYTITCELKEETSVGAVNSWAKVKKTFSVTIKPFK